MFQNEKKFSTCFFVSLFSSFFFPFFFFFFFFYKYSNETIFVSMFYFMSRLLRKITESMLRFKINDRLTHNWDNFSESRPLLFPKRSCPELQKNNSLFDFAYD